MSAKEPRETGDREPDWKLAIIGIVIALLMFAVIAPTIMQGFNTPVGNNTTYGTAAPPVATAHTASPLEVYGTSSMGLAFTPNSSYVYTTDSATRNISIFSSPTNQLVQTIITNTSINEPYGIAISPNGSYAYVACFASNMGVLSLKTNSLLTTVSPSGGYAIALSPNGSYAYITNASNDVVVLNTTNLHIAKVITGFNIPYGIAISPNGSYAYVSNEGATTVSVIDTTSYAIVATITVGTSPYGVTVLPNGKFAYVSNYGSASVSVINTTTYAVAATIGLPGGAEPAGIASTPDSKYVYVAEYNLGYTNFITTAINAVTGQVPGGSSVSGKLPYSVAISPDGNWAYTVNGTLNGGLPGQPDASGYVTIIHTGINVNTQLIGDGGTEPTYPVLSSNGNYAYGLSGVNEAVFQLSTGTRTTLIGLASTSSLVDQQVISPDGSYIYTTFYPDNSVTIFSTATNTLIGTINIPQGSPEGIAIAPSGSYLYVTDYASANVNIINTATNTIVGNISVGTEPNFISITANGNYAFVSNYGSNDVSVIDLSNNTVIKTIATGGNTQYSASDPNGLYEYISGGGHISAVSLKTLTSVFTFGTSGALTVSPSGYYVYIGEGGAIGVYNEYGQWLMNIRNVNCVTMAIAQNGTFLYSQGNPSVNALGTYFTQLTYGVFYTETGLASGTLWTVSFSDNPETVNTSITNVISFYEFNGNYKWMAEPVSSYTITPSAGAVIVSGTSQNIAISYSRNWIITFIASGLPVGTLWNVNYGGTIYSATTGSGGAGTEINVTVPQGNVLMYVYANGYYSNPSTFNNYVGSNQTVKVAFTVAPGSPFNVFSSGDLMIFFIIFGGVLAVVVILLLRRRN